MCFVFFHVLFPVIYQALKAQAGIVHFDVNGSNFVRILGAVPAVLRDVVEFHVGDLPMGSSALAQEVHAFCRDAWAKYRARENRSDIGPGNRQKSISRYEEKWRRFLEVWKASFVAGDKIHVFVPERVDRDSYIKTMARRFSDLFLSLALCKPEHGKWTKLTCALDWAVSMGSVNDMLNLLVQKAGAPLTGEAGVGGGGGGPATPIWAAS